MGRKTQVSKDVILQAALEMLIRDGYSAMLGSGEIDHPEPLRINHF